MKIAKTCKNFQRKLVNPNNNHEVIKLIMFFLVLVLGCRCLTKRILLSENLLQHNIKNNKERKKMSPFNFYSNFLVNHLMKPKTKNHKMIWSPIPIFRVFFVPQIATQKKITKSFNND